MACHHLVRVFLDCFFDGCDAFLPIRGSHRVSAYHLSYWGPELLCDVSIGVPYLLLPFLSLNWIYGVQLLDLDFCLGGQIFDLGASHGQE